MLETLERMTNTLHHRGPDAGGTWTNECVALGHRRLSILDLSEAGAQPMHSSCGRYVIVFNGEIYNHNDIRASLESTGAAPHWRGNSDTETLLAGICHWGLDEMLVRAAGMFAIALWDCKERKLSLARDRMGEKPLYWGWAGPTLVFGSELKALRQHPDFPREVCRTALAQFLTFTYVPAPYSIHPGIYKLEPGNILEIDGPPPTVAPIEPLRAGQHHANISIRRFWSLNQMIQAASCDPITSESEAIQAIETTLSNAVKRQMLADVPLGAFLSGGIDSSLIVALMQAQSSRPIQTFTIGFENKAFDESQHAAAVAKHLGTDHMTSIVTEAEAQATIPQLPDLYDEPFADSSQVPTHLVCRAARANVTVALSGDAGDELFGGYNRYFWGPRIWKRLSWVPMPARQILADLIASIPLSAWNGLGQLVGKRYSVSRAGEKAHRLADSMRSVRNIDDLYCSLVSEWPGLDLVPDAKQALVSILKGPMPETLANDPAGQMMFQDMRSYLPDDILCKVDRAAMGIGLETRVPFLDPEMMMLAARLPSSMKIREGQGKWALRQVLYEHVPRKLIERPKTGFSIPVGNWLRGPLRDWAEDLLSEEKLGKDQLLDPSPIRQAWAEHLSGQRDWTPRLWTILMLQAWRERWH